MMRDTLATALIVLGAGAMGLLCLFLAVGGIVTAVARADLATRVVAGLSALLLLPMGLLLACFLWGWYRGSRT